MSLPPILRDTPIDWSGTSGAERVPSVPAVPAADQTPSTSNINFGDMLTDAFKNANSDDKQADDLATRFAHGDPSVGIHEAMIASEKATISFKYAVTLKNKAIEAYKELMNTQI